MTDEELRKVYDECFEGAVVAQESQAEAFSAALRAVFLAGARAQREMEPTKKMVAEACDVEYLPLPMWVRMEKVFLAMQRVAPLAGENNVV